MIEHAFVTGANRGLGLEFVRQLSALGATTTGTYREVAPDLGGVQWAHLDLTTDETFETLARTWDERTLDLLVLNAGVTDRPSVLGQLDYAAWEQAFRINVVSAVRVVEALRPALRRSGRGKVVALSSELASIGGLTRDTSSWRLRGAYYAYRTSKAALNAAVKLLALELADDRICIAAIDPGWVRTDMGGADAPLSAADAVARVLRLVEQLESSRSGSFMRADGTAIPL